MYQISLVDNVPVNLNAICFITCKWIRCWHMPIEIETNTLQSQQEMMYYPYTKFCLSMGCRFLHHSSAKTVEQIMEHMHSNGRLGGGGGGGGGRTLAAKYGGAQRPQNSRGVLISISRKARKLFHPGTIFGYQEALS